MKAQRRQSQVDTDLTAESGVDLVGLVVKQRLKWLFRRQLESDYGIDAHVEIADPNATGLLLALQIKSGKSAFRRKRETGWEFPVEARHGRYWLGHSLPVLLVLVDLETQTPYWQWINAETLTPAGQGFKVLVPAAQTIASAKDRWRSLARQYFDRTQRSVDANMSALPHSVAASFELLGAKDAVATALLAAELASYRADPASGLRSLLDGRRAWLDTLPGEAWRAIAHFAREHELAQIAAEISELAADHDPSHRAQHLVTAGLFLRDLGDDRARNLIAEAAVLEPGLPSVLVALTVEDGDRSRLDGVEGPAVHTYFATVAAQQNDLDEEIVQWRQAVKLDPRSTRLRQALGEALARRQMSLGGEETDGQEAIDQLQLVLEQKRPWSTKTANALETQLKALILESRFSEAMQKAAPLPYGTATVDEAGDWAVARLAMLIARKLGQRERLQQIASRIADAEDRELALRALRLDAKTTLDERVQYYRAEGRRASEKGDWAAAVGAAFQLAQLGNPDDALLSAIRGSNAVPPETLELVDLIGLGPEQRGQHLADFRRLARVDIMAAEYLIETLASDGQQDEAARVAHAAAQRFKSASLSLREAQLLFDLKREDDAVAVLIEQIDSLRGADLLNARMTLGNHYLRGHRWNEALAEFASAREAAPDESAAFWGYTAALLNLGALDKARDLIDLDQFVPEDPFEIEVWARTVSQTGWTAETASFAATLSLREDIPPDLAAALATSIVAHTKAAGPGGDLPEGDRRPEVPSEVHVQAFQAINQLVEKHGPINGLQIIKVDEESIVEQLSSLLREQKRGPILDLVRQARRGQVPYGMLTEVKSDPYSLTLANRHGQIRTVSRFDGAGHERETLVAKGAVGSSIVIDTSAIETALELGKWPTPAGLFNVMLVAKSQQTDADLAVLAARGATASSGWIGLDAEGRFQMTESDPEGQLAILQRVEAIAETMHELDAKEVAGERKVMPDLAGSRASVWLDAVELAAREHLPLWADDLGLRNLAEAVGVPAFSTINLVEAEILDSIYAASGDAAELERVVAQQGALLTLLLEHRIVDQPVTEADLMTSIRAHPGRVSPASEVIGRAAWWSEHQDLDWWMRVAKEVTEHAPDSVRIWQRLAVTGLAENASPDLAARIAACLAIIGTTEARTVEEATIGFQIADYVMRDYDLPLASEHIVWAAASVSAWGLLDAPEAFAADVLARLAGQA